MAVFEMRLDLMLMLGYFRPVAPFNFFKCSVFCISLGIVIKLNSSLACESVYGIFFAASIKD